MDDVIPAGNLADWLAQMQEALAGGESDVPCGECTACCRSAHFIHVGADEAEALWHIPRKFLVPAPGAADGTLVMGFDEFGHCPMLGDDGCSIYEHRPQACRVYDCRVFAATGVEPDKPAVAEQVARWQFFGEDDVVNSVRAAASYLEGNELSAEVRPQEATRTAVAAIRIHSLFRDAAPSRTEVEQALAQARRRR